MDASDKRLVEVRLLVLVSVNVNSDEFIEHIRRHQNASVADVVSSEVVSNLESVPYVEVAIATHL